MDAIDLISPRDDDDEDEDDDDCDTNADGSGNPKDDIDCDAKGDPSLAKNVRVLTLLPLSSNRNFYIQRTSSALLSGNISKNLSSVSELTSHCTLFPLT